MQRIAVLLTLSIALLLPAQLEARGIKESDIREHIAVLASDDFEGRAPGTAGEDKTINYIAEEWGSAGLSPASRNGDWFDPVPLMSYKPISDEVRFKRNRRSLRFNQKDIILVGNSTDYTKKAVPVHFAGTGLRADGSIVTDVAGKAVLMLLDVPEDVKSEFRSPRKRSAAMIADGAEAVIYITSSDDWKATLRRFRRASINLKGQRARAPIQGAISTEFAVGLVTSGGRDWDKLLAKGDGSDFNGIDLGITGEFNVSTEISQIDSANVIGKIPGRKPGNGAVLFLGHWDHFGYCGDEGDEDRICNGAVDNASGIAVLIEVAEKLARKKHDRDIYFLATTAEERGLFGAYEYARNPAFPLKDVVIALNIDTIAIAPRGAKVAIVGRGTTPLDKVVEKVARKQKRKIEETDDANAFIERQDGWALTEQGVPALMVGGSFADMELLQKFLSGPYHGVDDELTDETELGGAAEDADLHVALGKYFASTRKYKRAASGD